MFGQEEENDQVAGQAGIGGEDESSAFRRLQSRRKARSVEFLANPVASFHLLASLTVALVISPIINHVFQLSESDKSQITQKDSSRQKERMKRRMRSKGSEAAMDNQSKHTHFRRTKVLALQCIERLWTEMFADTPSIFSCATSYWPSSEPLRFKFDFLCENMLRCICALKWRLVQRFSCPPWSLCELQDDELPPETVFCLKSVDSDSSASRTFFKSLEFKTICFDKI